MRSAEIPPSFVGPQTTLEAGVPPYTEAAVVPQPTAPEEAAPNGPSIKFIAWEHIPGNAKMAADLAADCDVLAIEFLADNERQRRHFNAVATTFLSSTATPRQHRKAEKYLERVGGGAITGILDQLQGTDKRVVVIDINARKHSWSTSENQEYTEAQAIHNGHDKFKQAVAEGKQSSETKPILTDWATRVGRSNVYREAQQVSQVEALAEEYRDTNAKIGVIVGAVHTPTSHALSRKYPTERVFAVPGESGSQQHYFGSDNQLIRHKRFFPDRPAPDKLLNRMIVGQQYMPGEYYRPEDARIIDRMTDAELSDTVVAIDGINATIAAEGLRRKAARAERDARIGALLRAKFDKVVQRTSSHTQ